MPHIRSMYSITLANINHLSLLSRKIYSAGNQREIHFFPNRKSIKCVVYYVKICHQVLNNVSNSLKRKKKKFFFLNKKKLQSNGDVMVWQSRWGNQISYFSPCRYNVVTCTAFFLFNFSVRHKFVLRNLLFLWLKW